MNPKKKIGIICGTVFGGVGLIFASVGGYFLYEWINKDNIYEYKKFKNILQL